MIRPGTQNRESSIAILVLGSGFLVLLACALALLPLAIACALVGGAVAVVLALIDPLWAVCWAILSVPVQEFVHLPGGVTVTQVTLLLAIGAWGLRVLAYPQREVRLGPLGLPLVLLLCALAVSSMFSPYSPFEGLKETLRWTWVLLVYAIVVNHVTDQRRAFLVLTCLLLAPTADALLGLWQFVTATGPPSFGIAGGRFMRAYGTIGQPNSFAGYMNMAWPLAVALALGLWRGRGGRRQKAEGTLEKAEGRRHPRDGKEPPREGRRQKAEGREQAGDRNIIIGQEWWIPIIAVPCSVFCAVLLLAALFASFSRGGWVGAIGGGLGMALATLIQPRLLDGQRRQAAHTRGWVQLVVLGAVLGVLLMLLSVAGLLPSAVATRLDSITANLRLFDVRSVEVTPENFAVVERMAHIQAGWGMFTTHPLLGVGPGNFTLAYPAFAIPPWYISQGHAHNYYLHMAAEAGIVGATLYLVLIAMVVRQALRALRSVYDPIWRMILFGGCGMIAAVMIHNLFENLHVLNLPLQLGAVWGLLVVAEHSDKVRE